MDETGTAGGLSTVATGTGWRATIAVTLVAVQLLFERLITFFNCGNQNCFYQEDERAVWGSPG